MSDRASGFCIYNDIAVGIRWLLDQGSRRSPTSTSTSTTATESRSSSTTTAGAHHLAPRDRADPLSRHGFPQDSGGPDAEGSAVNVALPPGTSDAVARAFHAVVPPLVREFAPEVLVTQHGCDSHRDDPLADLMLSVDGQRASYVALHELADEVCGGRWVVTGGGGYALVEVVPRAWTHLLAVVGGFELAPDTRTPTPGASTSRRASAAPRRTASPTAATPPSGTGARATTRPPGSIGRSSPRGRRSSRCTASTRCSERGTMSAR